MASIVIHPVLCLYLHPNRWVAFLSKIVRTIAFIELVKMMKEYETYGLNIICHLQTDLSLPLRWHRFEFDL